MIMRIFERSFDIISPGSEITEIKRQVARERETEVGSERDRQEKRDRGRKKGKREK